MCIYTKEPADTLIHRMRATKICENELKPIIEQQADKPRNCYIIAEKKVIIAACEKYADAYLIANALIAQKAYKQLDIMTDFGLMYHGICT